MTDVRMVPRTNNTYLVDIYYKLTNGSAYVTLSIETNAAAAPAWSGVKIPDRCVVTLSGDVSRLIAADEVNEKHIVWNAGADWPGQGVREARAKISAWSPGNPPRYLVLDLGGACFTNTLQMTAYSSEESLPYGGLSNDVYRTALLVLRRISQGSFWMGSPTWEFGHDADEDYHSVTLTNDFYVGVFEVTQGQWYRVMNGFPSTNINSAGLSDMRLRPVEKVSFDDIRGGTWPAEGDAPAANSFVGRLRSKTGQRFDLPTEAQWEYACRAGTSTSLNNGLSLVTSTVLDTNRLPIAWDAFNSGSVLGVNDPNSRRHHRVGEKVPNAWGLFDMIGNVNETVRDWYVDHLGTSAATEPKGPSSGTARVRKSGAYDGQVDPRSAYRNTTGVSPSIGFRLALVPWE